MKIPFLLNNKVKSDLIYAIFGISSLSSISIGLQNTLDSITNVFFDRQLGSVILSVSILSFGIGLSAPTLYNYFFPPISPTIPISPISSIIEKTLEKTESLIPPKDVFISSVSPDSAIISITDLTFLKDTLTKSAAVLTDNHVLLTYILKSRLSTKFKPPSNTSIYHTSNEIDPVLDNIELATQLIETQLTIASHVDSSIVSQITNL